MKFSLFMMPCHQPGENPTLAFQRDIGLIHYAEELGFDEAYIGEHHSGGWETHPAPEMSLSMAAAKAQRIRLGTSVFSVPFHHPFFLAERMAFLDHLTHGRAILGVGPCSLVTDKILFNMENEALYPMLHEAVDVMVRLLESDEPISHHGEYWQFDEALPVPKPYQQPHPPIWVGAHSPASLEYAARNNFNVSQNLDTDTTIAEKFDLYRKIWQECEHGGPMPRTFLTRAVHVAETDEKAKAEAEGPLVASRGLGRQGIAETRLGSHNNNEGTPSQKELARVFQGMSTSLDFWLDNGLALVGSPETVTRKLKEQYELMGYDIFTAAHRIGNMPQEQSLNSLKLFAQEVMPAFR